MRFYGENKIHKLLTLEDFFCMSLVVTNDFHFICLVYGRAEAVDVHINQFDPSHRLLCGGSKAAGLEYVLLLKLQHVPWKFDFNVGRHIRVFIHSGNVTPLKLTAIF